MKRGVLVLLFIAFSYFIPSAYAACINPGTVDGYIFNMSSGIVTSASVTVTVSSCSGDCCSANATSQTNGYYVVTGLQVSSGSSVTASATKGAASGSNTGTINSFLISQVNVTLCTSPSAPTLTSPANGNMTHNGTNIAFSWTSGTDPFGFSVFDQFVIDSTTTNETSPVTRNLTFGSHSWYAKTCNSLCCGTASSRTIIINNSAPSAPALTAEPDTDSTSVTLEWTSGTDPDNDAIHDEFQLSNTSDYSTIISSDSTASSPKTASSLPVGTIYWRVRTCDSSSCGSYSTDIFNIVNCAVCPGGGSGGESNPFSGSEATKYIGIPCVPSWVCGEYGGCQYGIQARNCVDESSCNIVLPETKKSCDFASSDIALESPVTVSGVLYFGNLDKELDKRREIKKGQEWKFTYNKHDHMIKVEKIEKGVVTFIISSSPLTVLMEVNQVKAVDLDADGRPDITLVLHSVVDDTVDVTIRIAEIEKMVENPTEIITNGKVSTQTITEILKPSLFTTILFILIALGAGFSLGLMFERTADGRKRRLDQSLINYIHSSLQKGHKESEIVRKLSDSGWTDEEIAFALGKELAKRRK